MKTALKELRVPMNMGINKSAMNFPTELTVALLDCNG